jgi:hypothetical protein
MNNQQQITPEIALQILVNAAKQAKLTYDEHITVANCAQFLDKLLIDLKNANLIQPQ